jgi:hypothetical protein
MSGFEISDSLIERPGLEVLSTGNTNTIWIVNHYPDNRKDVTIKFPMGLVVEKMNWDNKWKVISSTNISNSGILNTINTNTEYTIEEILLLINNKERIEIIKNIKTITGLSKEELIESLTSKDLIDFIIFNIELLLENK